MQTEISDSCLQGPWRSCGCSSDRKGCQCHTTESSPFQLLAHLVTFSAMLSFIFSAPVIFTSWTGWVMIWQSSALPHNLHQHYEMQATWSVCPGFCPCVQVLVFELPYTSDPSHTALFLCSSLPPPPKNCPFFFFLPLIIFASFKIIYSQGLIPPS